MRLTQDAVSRGQPADRLLLCVGDPHRQELGEPGALRDHAQRPVLGVHDHHRRFHDAAQHLRQIQPPAHRQHGFQQQIHRLAGTLPQCVEALLQLVRQRIEPAPGGIAPAVSVVAHCGLRWRAPHACGAVLPP
ncbi:hypothetical protein [Streptomyces lydicamycinicus]|uniref:hypothetical protein n=1 Tax=Streptomyces lydicamycinicus TaxID=1546107 RepID=UPI0032DE9F18